MKNTSLITILIIIIVVFAIYIFIYGNEKLCKKGNLVNGYCETERTIFTMGLCPNGYNFFNDRCVSYNGYNYANVNYSCPFGYKINSLHVDLGFSYKCCYKNITDRVEAKTRFYYWFND